MTYLSTLPKTKFTLPNGQIVDSVNILKSVVLSENFKTNSNSVKKVYYDQIKRIENVSFRQYSQNLSLYWLVLLLNDIDSFSKVPFQQSLFETIFRETYQGTVYYIRDAKNTFTFLPNDLVLLKAGDDWKVGGLVKEYDPIFRRIILKKQFENSDNSATLSDQTMFVYRRSGVNYEIVNDSLLRGRVENEFDKVIKIYDQTSLSVEISPYLKSDGTFDFSNEPSGTILNDLCYDTLVGYNLYTFLEDESFKNASYKNLKFVNTQLGFKLNSFLSTLSSQNFSRGQVINVT